MGTLTFGALARLNDYRSTLSSTAKNERPKGPPIQTVSSQIPTGKVDARTEQALKWSGLKTASSKNETSSSSLFGNPQSFTNQGTTPALDFAYSFASIKGILAYRDALVAQAPGTSQQSAGHTVTKKY